jgi:hypothetical protein
MDTKFSDSETSIVNLCLLQMLLDEYIKLHSKEFKNPDSVMAAVLGEQMIIKICSFLDEWKSFGSNAKNDPRVVELRQSTKAATKQLNSWSDIYLVRNTIIAHTFRDKKKENVSSLLTEQMAFNSPISHFDYRLACGCIHLIVFALKAFFHKEYNLLIPKLTEARQHTFPFEIKSKEECTSRFDAISNAVHQAVNEKMNQAIR